MQQKPRGAALAFGREGVEGVGEGGVMFTRPPWPLGLIEPAETTADPAGANNCFLSTGISVASSEDKLTALWGHGTLTWLQPTTCLNVRLQPSQTQHSCQQQQHRAIPSVNRDTEGVQATSIQDRQTNQGSMKFQLVF